MSSLVKPVEAPVESPVNNAGQQRQPARVETTSHEQTAHVDAPPTRVPVWSDIGGSH